MSTISDYFATLRDWKHLPAYKAETRVDSIVGFALPQILSHALDFTVAVVIPELPLRIGSVQPENASAKFANKSFKVDFFVVTECGKNLLIEFKTDSNSRKQSQDIYLKKTAAKGLTVVISGIIELLGATSYKKKYLHLIDKLADAGVIKEINGEFQPSIKNDDLEIVYIQPHKKENEVNSEKISFIDFHTVANAIEQAFKNDEFMREAANSFRSWSED